MSSALSLMVASSDEHFREMVRDNITNIPNSKVISEFQEVAGLGRIDEGEGERPHPELGGEVDGLEARARHPERGVRLLHRRDRNDRFGHPERRVEAGLVQRAAGVLLRGRLGGRRHDWPRVGGVWFVAAP